MVSCAVSNQEKQLKLHKKPLIEKYISDNRITRKDILQYAPLLLDKAIRTFVEGESIFSFKEETSCY